LAYEFIKIRKLDKTKTANTLRIAINVMFVAILVFSTISGTLITGNFFGDALFWVLLYICAVWQFIPRVPKSQQMISYILKLTVSIMMLVYYCFDKEMGRYVLLVLPYFFVIVAVEFDNIVSIVAKKWYLLVSVCLCLLIAMQAYYVLSFPKYTVADYNSEVSQSVIQTIYGAGKSTLKPTLYVAQQDAFLWADFLNAINVEFLSKENYDEVLSLAARHISVSTVCLQSVYFFEDPSIEYKQDAYFAQDSHLSIITGTVKTNAKFWVNAIQTDGWYRLWTTCVK
jgi:hypothetical protein